MNRMILYDSFVERSKIYVVIDVKPVLKLQRNIPALLIVLAKCDMEEQAQHDKSWLGNVFGFAKS